MTLLLDDAYKRLDTALTLLEAAIARRSAGEKGRGDLEVELQIMQDDRTRLAVELDAALARLRRHETASEDVGRRVRAAMEAIRTVLERARTLEPQDG
jgi:predicted  nucleic acid-binding Zn-ribbon protein